MGASKSTLMSSDTSSSPNGNYGQRPEETLNKYGDVLTSFEKSELCRYELIYCVGSVRRESLMGVADREGYYVPVIGEQIGYRY